MTAPHIMITEQTRSLLGEGPAWWASESRLVSVDIPAGLVRKYDPVLGEESCVSIGGELSAVVPRRAGGVIAAVGRELRAYDSQGTLEQSWNVEEAKQNNRFNDCRADAHGRVWAGTMSKTRTVNDAALYLLDATGRLAPAIAPTTLSNGIGWAPDQRTMYFIDSTTYQVDALDIDPRSACLSNRRTFAAIEPHHGLPDGLTVDTEGGVWIALFGGSALRRYSHSGHLTHNIPLPVTNPTCPAFGGHELDTLFVTSAKIKLTEAQLQQEPAGALLSLRGLGFQGFPANECTL